MKVEVFAKRLEESLKRRYDCKDVDIATPSTILLAVLNAVAEARQGMESEQDNPECRKEGKDDREDYGH